MIQERESLRIKEQELVGDIENLESNSKNLEIMREEEMQRMQKVIKNPLLIEIAYLISGGRWASVLKKRKL